MGWDRATDRVKQWKLNSVFSGRKGTIGCMQENKEKKTRNSANKSVSRSVDYCSSKLLQTDVDCSGFRVWAVRPSQLAVIYLCATRGPQWASVRSGPPKNKFLQTDHRPPPVKCFAVSAAISDYLWGYLSSISDLSRHIPMKGEMTANTLISQNTQKGETKSVRSVLRKILQNSKTLSTVIEQCTTKDNTRLQCFWLEVITYVQR